MNKKLRRSESEACEAKRLLPKLVPIIAHFFETVWAMGTGVAAAMAISTSIRRAGRDSVLLRLPVWLQRHA